MYDNQLYTSGIYGVFITDWMLCCETPLAIRNGMRIGYKDKDQRKSRGMGLRFQWQLPQKGINKDNEVAVLHYGYEVTGDHLTSYHFVPPSSLRGALRSWTINHLVHQDYRREMSPPAKEDQAKTEAYLAAVQRALADAKSGYQWIASLFGLAFDSRGAGDNLANAGRLKVETERFNHAQPQPIAVNGKLDDGMAGPTNALRQMTVRNPLDRVTHASKEGGLHHFLEFSPGEQFRVRLTILNPRASDLGLISLWRRELNAGLLRIGALSSIGRGRVSVNQELYQLWLRPGAPQFDGLAIFLPDENLERDDVLAGLWQSYTLPDSSLDQFMTYLQEES